MKNITAILISQYFFISIATGGDWGSTGGEFIKDQSNPWFLKNTKVVNYCIEYDEKSFSANPASILKLIKKSFQYWKSEFSSKGTLLGIANQNFKLNHDFPLNRCKGNEDLKFVLGYGALSQKELNFFSSHGEKPNDYLGVAIRTSYDKKKLKGKGFIYISSDMGKHSYHQGSSTTEKLWSFEGILFRILQHEVGHIFGITHTSNGFMSAGFPEFMIRNFRNYRTLGPRIPFFSPPANYEKCKMKRKFKKVIPYSCYKISSSDNWKSFDIFSLDKLLNLKKYGQSLKLKRTSPQIEFPINVFFPDEQKVFKTLKNEKVWKGPSRKYFKILAEFETEEDKKSKAMMLDLSPENIEGYIVNDIIPHQIF